MLRTWSGDWYPPVTYKREPMVAPAESSRGSTHRRIGRQWKSPACRGRSCLSDRVSTTRCHEGAARLSRRRAIFFPLRMITDNERNYMRRSVLQGRDNRLRIGGGDDEAIAGGQIGVAHVDVGIGDALKHAGGRAGFILDRYDHDLLLL